MELKVDSESEVDDKKKILKGSKIVKKNSGNFKGSFGTYTKCCWKK